MIPSIFEEMWVCIEFVSLPERIDEVSHPLELREPPGIVGQGWMRS
jgi:hypothetical protein